MALGEDLGGERISVPVVTATTPVTGLVRYQQSGVSVDFTTPTLANARIRPDDLDRLEVIISDLAGGRGQYVVPLSHLTRVVNLTVHDRTLTEEILHRNARSPDEIRRATLSVAKMGLAGQKAAKLARQTIDDESNERRLVTVYLIHTAIRHTTGATGSANVPLSELAAAANRAVVKSRLEIVAEKARVSPDVVYNVLEEWGGVIGTVGVPGMPVECRFRRIARQVFELASQIRRWSEEEISHLGDRARTVAEAADRVGAKAQKDVDGIDKFAAGIVGTISRWRDARDQIVGRVAEVAWTLNGWEQSIARWRAAAQQDHDAQIRTVSAILATLPQEAEVASADLVRDEVASRRSGTRTVQAHQDWKTGAIDFDAVRRLEQLKELGT